ncbi:Sulfonamide resistance protein [Legionella massiliensis]|uniref:Sulfonamide resistance protein n=1 Tax=Legionella massiliensis TaxID=1034943 RepID=A0A078KWJ0_9GAMM|nr:MFS transporter [Legionella massiliensis]CDZ78835.1 Sulfonamide resistance protein [Legionella massiliensis]CEE14573.1 Bicyclomycin resistance protein [Legionella massiliensis]
MVTNFRIAWLLSYISIASFSAAFLTPALPQIQLYYGLQAGQVEWVVSAFLFGYVFGQLLYGPLANRWGRVFSLRTGLIINLFGVSLCLLSLACNSFALVLIGRLISALGTAAGLACTFMLINEWLAESQRKTAMAYTILSFTFGIGLAVTLGGIISEYGSWTYCFMFLLIHGLVMLLGTVAFPETLVESQAINFLTIFTGYTRALTSQNLVLFSLVVGFCSIIGYCFSAAGPQIAHQILHLSSAEYGYWNLLNMLGMLAGGIFAKKLLNRLQAKQVIAIGFAGCILGILSLGLMDLQHSSSAVWFFLSTLSLYLFSGLLFAGGSLIASNALADKASCSAMMSFINMSTATVAVVLMGYLGANALQAFIEILAGMWLLIVTFLVLDKINIVSMTLPIHQKK